MQTYDPGNKRNVPPKASRTKSPSSIPTYPVPKCEKEKRKTESSFGQRVQAAPQSHIVKS
ncbi:hypothetical protein L873DRAFT_1820949 [Choiromyces venosus 120613-1]|uniref:Uncharacterized protein n=1 Tax=Choiromyces venosus 120613-1 TaxID=1336337 RepID=A0A3N4IZV8_9PEZI|nr:hypothetical protein L873DRAFT_1820949 [Choiromyces venosus 120613-1]